MSDSDLSTDKDALENVRVHQGPLPSPAMLSEYEKISPGFAERIIKMAELEQIYRKEMELQAIEEYRRATKRSQLFAISVSLISIIGSVTLAFSGAEIAGGIIGSATMLGIVASFVLGRSNKVENPGSEENE